MDNVVSKMKFNFKQPEKEIGMCSDGAMVNRSVYRLLCDKFGEQYLCILCLSHKFEHSINDAFGSSVLSNNTEKDCIEIYYFLKKVTIVMASIQVAKFIYGFRQKVLQKIKWNKKWYIELLHWNLIFIICQS